MTTNAQLTDVNAIAQFILAGSATFTLVSKATGTRFTFKASKADDSDMWFVSVLNGPDNWANYAYLGIIRQGRTGFFFTRTAKSKVSQDAPSHKAISWFLERAFQPDLFSGLDKVEFWHCGKCARCGRKLTVPSSIASGIGPECAAKMMAA